MDLQLDGKTAIITGGSRGIGKAIARQLAMEGVDVAIVARNQGGLESAAAELSDETTRRILPIAADTGNDDSVQSMAQQVIDAFEHIDILVNAAAKPAGAGRALADVTDELFWEDMNIKVLGYLRCVRAVVPSMTEQGWGRIINISGLAARSSGSIIGGIRNVAVVTMAKNLADELGPKGINVTVVHPGRVATDAVRKSFAEQAAQLDVAVEEIERRIAAANSARKVITPEDIAYVVAFLASPRSVAINGDVVAAGGGMGPAIYY